MFLGAFADLGMSEEANWHAAEFVRNKIRETVKDPATAELLCPDGIIGCKRLCADTNYYQTYNRENVHLVDVSETPIERFTSSGLITGGNTYEFDDVVFATGFDALTDLQPFQRRQHIVPQAARTDHRRDDDHIQRQHDHLIHADHEHLLGRRHLHAP